MNARFLRPLARAAVRPSTLVRPTLATSARPAIAGEAQRKNGGQMTILKSAMPQLIPFFFMNEVTTAFILVPGLIYVMSKYILPQKVRLFAARLFISKL